MAAGSAILRRQFIGCLSKSDICDSQYVEDCEISIGRAPRQLSVLTWNTAPTPREPVTLAIHTTDPSSSFLSIDYYTEWDHYGWPIQKNPLVLVREDHAQVSTSSNLALGPQYSGLIWYIQPKDNRLIIEGFGFRKKANSAGSWSDSLRKLVYERK